jgi:hypothetical protein
MTTAADAPPSTHQPSGSADAPSSRNHTSTSPWRTTRCADVGGLIRGERLNLGFLGVWLQLR